MMPEASAEAVAMIEGFEISSPSVYSARYTRPTWPGGASGVTIGVGYDLGYQTPEQISADWSPHLPEITVARLCHCAGIKAAPAGLLAPKLRDVVVPWAAAAAVFRGGDIARYSALTRQTFDCAGLSPDSFGALVSLVFNRGTSLAEGPPPDVRREMRAIRSILLGGHPYLVPAQIRSMKRLWEGKTSLAGLVARREAEAVLFEQGLQPSADDLNAAELERVG